MKQFFIFIVALMVMLMAIPAMASACGGCLGNSPDIVAMLATPDVMPSAADMFGLDAIGGSYTNAPGGAIISKRETFYDDKYFNVTLIDTGGGGDGCHLTVDTRKSYMTTRTFGKHMIPYARDMTAV